MSIRHKKVKKKKYSNKVQYKFNEHFCLLRLRQYIIQINAVPETVSEGIESRH